MPNERTGHDDAERQQHGHHEQGHGYRHHGHENDQGIKGAMRYLRWLSPRWRSPINNAVVDLVDPQAADRSFASRRTVRP